MTSNKGILIIGATPQGLRAALTLAQFGRKVTLIERDLEVGRAPEHWSEQGKRWNRYLLAQVSYHPLIELFTETDLTEIKERDSSIQVQLTQRPQWVLPGSCVDCQKCLLSCPVDLSDGRKPLFHVTAPNTMAIDKRKEAPCRLACPLGMNTQGYVALIGQGRFEEAYEVILDTNPLPGICGRICPHPCEEACRRQELDEPVAICALKRFATDQARKGGKKSDQGNGSPPEGPRVAIIGSGPAGLTAAHDLAKAGFRPTLIEAEGRPGGLLKNAIAPFRLPGDILEQEIRAILALGVDLRLNTSIRSVEDLETLKAEGFRAILLATGTSKDLPLNIEGEDLERVYGCVAFLKDLWNGIRPEPMGRVVVIGGGNAAVEAARASVRTGAEAVTLVYRRSREEMPASEWEVQEALEEGVTIIHGLGPNRFLERGGKLSGVEFKRLTAVFDEKGAFNPQYDETDLSTIEADTAIVAIGQTAGLSFANGGSSLSDGGGEGLQFTQRGTIKVDGRGETNIPGIYASGDAVSGPSTVVEAMASGRRAAQMIIRTLRPDEEAGQIQESGSSPREYEPLPKGLPRQDRRPLPRRKVSERIKDNEEVIGPLSVKEATREASRCLQCGVCSECLRCQVACELGAIRHDRRSTQVSLQFDRIIVADQKQTFPLPESSRVVQMSSFGKTRSWARASVVGRAAAMDALSDAPLVQATLTPTKALGGGDSRIGVFVCSCNGTLDEKDQLSMIIDSLKGAPNVAHAQVLLSACHPEKGRQIEEIIREKELNGALVASCTCCHLDFACESCNDQRIRLKHRLFREAGYDPRDIVLVNIKETCLLPLREESKKGIELAVRAIRSGLCQLREHREWPLMGEEPKLKALILGATEAGLTAAKGLRDRFDSVVVVDNQEVGEDIQKELRGLGIGLLTRVSPFGLQGQRGAFTLFVESKETINPGEERGTPEGFRNTRGRTLYSVDSQSLDEDPHYQKISADVVILGRSEFKGIPYRRDAFARGGHLSAGGVFATLETGIPGVYLASWAQARKVPEQAFGKAAASKALEEILGKDKSLDNPIAQVNSELCRGCGRCADICPEGAAFLEEISRGVTCSRIEPQFCIGCGNCLAECPTGAISMPESGQEYFQEVMDVFLG